MKKDPTSLSSGSIARIRHISIQWTTDFENKKLFGSARLSIEIIEETDKVILDTNKLNVSRVYLIDAKENQRKIETNFKYGTTHPNFGAPLEVSLLKKVSPASLLDLEVHYETGSGDECSALQWLPAEQTKDKTHPFMFSQCQAIHARSLLPCFDYPGQKFTYDATLKVPTSCVALMSALLDNDKSDTPQGIFYFSQPIPIPSYLLAVCVGVLGKRDISDRCSVFAEPSFVDECKWEFDTTETFLTIAENLLGTYEWTRYDLLVLPPSFPYGGMENPCLTFVTPTLVAKDRSLVTVIAHEITHSWTGNLVTNESWDHFWLNEGFTRFCEAKILAKSLHPRDAVAEKLEFDFQALMSHDTLKSTVLQFGETHPFTCLSIDHAQNNGLDPDDAFSSIPYEKGFHFLCYLQTLVGMEKFERFLKDYISEFKFKTVNSELFKNYFTQYFKYSGLPSIDWENWLHQPGMPLIDVRSSFDTKFYEDANRIGSNWLNSRFISEAEFADQSTDIKVVALSTVREGLKNATATFSCQELETRYKFSSSNNAEILFEWFMCCIESGFEPVLTNPKLLDFLRTVGRMKYTRSLYKALKARGGEFEALAFRLFTQYRTSYHAICQKMVARDLGL